MRYCKKVLALFCVGLILFGLWGCSGRMENHEDTKTNRLDLPPEHLELIRKTAEEFAGEAFAQSILLCPIGDRYHFLSGCTYIIQAGFYQRGGLV